MPTSSTSGKHLIDRAIQRLSTTKTNLSILDLGVGAGTYHDRYSSVLPGASWVGVEIWEPYIEKYALRRKYDVIHQEDVRKWVKQRTDRFDVCFVGDIAEHMTKEEAQEMVEDLLTFCDLVIISIPIITYPQGEFEGNPYEAHVKDDWSHAEVMWSFPSIVDYGNESEIGVYFLSRLAFEETKELLRPLIAVYAICKNEEVFAERFSVSVKSADHVTICDTGSTDSTISILESNLGIRVHQVHVSPWRFDDARNLALMLTPADADLCISLDLDEYLQDGWYPLLANEIATHYRTYGRLYDKYNCRFQTIWDWKNIQKDEDSVSTSSHWHERIHTRHNWKWRLPVHEVLTFTGNHKESWAWLGGFLMTQKPVVRETRSSYLSLLELSLREDPNVWKSWFFYADELLRAGRRDDAIEALKKAQLVPGCDQSYLLMMMGDYYAPINPMEAISSYQKACQLSSWSRERWVRLAQFCKENGHLEMARMAIEKAKECTEKSSGYDFNAWCWGPGFDELCSRLIGDKNE